MRAIAPFAIVAVLAAAASVACNDQRVNALPATNSEVHYQGGGAPPVDVLWVVDNSGSMADEQAKLAANFQSFIQYFQDLGLDFHLGITTTDTLTQDLTNWNGHDYLVSNAADGKLVGTPNILTPQTQNFANDFIQNVNVGTQGWVVERGLEGARLALSDPNLHGANTGFLRDNAILAIVIVSDEEDQSVADNSIPPSQSKADDPAWRAANLENPDDFTSFFLSLKNNNPAMVNVSAIVGLDPTTLEPADCDTSSQPNGDTADAGARYWKVAKALHGVTASICNPEFGPILDQIGATVTGLATAYPLQFTPDPSTITVKVDGVVVPEGPNGWTWNPTTNEISFAASAVPPSCAVIEIDYGVADYGNGIVVGNNEVPPVQCGVDAPISSTNLEGGAFSCDVHTPVRALRLGGFLAGAGLALAMVFRRRAAR